MFITTLEKSCFSNKFDFPKHSFLKLMSQIGRCNIVGGNVRNDLMQIHLWDWCLNKPPEISSFCIKTFQIFWSACHSTTTRLGYLKTIEVIWIHKFTALHKKLKIFRFHEWLNAWRDVNLLKWEIRLADYENNCGAKMNASAPQFSELEFHFIRLSLADFIVAALIPYRDSHRK